MSSKTFEELKIEFEEAKHQKCFHFWEYQKWEEKYNFLIKKIEESCNPHDWKIDRGNCSPRTHRECIKCGAYN